MLGDKGRKRGQNRLLSSRSGVRAPLVPKSRREAAYLIRDQGARRESAPLDARFDERDRGRAAMDGGESAFPGLERRIRMMSLVRRAPLVPKSRREAAS